MTCQYIATERDRAIADALGKLAEEALWTRFVGRRPIGNVRKLKNGAYPLCFRRYGEMRTHPEVFRARA